MASLGRTRAKEACRTAGRLWIEFAPSGHLRCAHLGAGRKAPDRSSTAEETDRRAAAAPLGVDLATFCGFGLDSAVAVDRAEEARREDSSLDIIVAALSCQTHNARMLGGGMDGCKGCWKEGRMLTSVEA